MKSITALLAGALIFAAVGLIALTAARVERHLADAQEQMATLQYADAAASLDAAEGYLDSAQWLPFVGDESLNEVRARRAALLYWQGDYAGVLPQQVEPVAAVDEANVELQLVVANAAFRVGLGGAKDRATALQALNDAANGYATVLRNATWLEDAAHNYEYAIRLRDQVAKGGRPPAPSPQAGADLGEGGAPTPATTMKGFEIYIPLEGSERTPEGGEAGKAAAKQRKG
jgi:hypothetical protein